MNHSTKGKISLLPRPLPEEVNRRMENNEQGRSIVAWLTSLKRSVRQPVTEKLTDG